MNDMSRPEGGLTEKRFISEISWAQLSTSSDAATADFSHYREKSIMLSRLEKNASRTENDS